MAKKPRRQSRLTISQFLLGLALFAVLMIGVFFYLDWAWDNTLERAKNFKVG